MTEFVRDAAGVSEAQQKKALAFLFAQDGVGLAKDGVLGGLGVSQTATASVSVLVAAGSAVVQDSGSSGASWLVSDTQVTLDVLTANPVGATPRNDLVVFDAATISAGAGGIRAIIGVPGASPTDPAVPGTAVPLARLRHAANATDVPGSAIDDLKVPAGLFGVSNAYLGVTAGNVGKRMHRQDYASGTTDANGFITVNHAAGFTPTAVAVVSRAPGSTFAAFWGADNLTSTSWRGRWFDTRGTGAYASAATGALTAFLYE